MSGTLPRNGMLRLQAIALLLGGCGVAKAQQAKRPPPPPPVLSAAEVSDRQSLEIEQAVLRLSSPDFVQRQAAQQRLLAAGGSAVPALTLGAQSDDLEVAVRCVEILRRVARDDGQSKSVLQALDELSAGDDTPITHHAARIYTELTQTELDRAVAQLSAGGVALHKVSGGRVYSAYNLRRNSQLSQLVHFPDLRMVVVTGPQVTDAGMTSLARLQKLHAVTLTGTSVTGAGLQRLQKSPELSSISLTADTLSLDDLRQLRHVSTLRSLSFTSLAGAWQLRCLEDLNQIGTLRLGEVRLGHDSVTFINRLKNLRSLRMTLTDASDFELEVVGQLKPELSLSVMQSAHLSSAGWASLSDARIRMLSVYQSDLDDDDLAAIASCRSLQSLYIRNASISDSGLKSLGRLPELRRLYLTGSTVSKSAIDQLQQERPSLRIR